MSLLLRFLLYFRAIYGHLQGASSYGPKAGDGEDDGFDITLCIMAGTSVSVPSVEVPFEISGVEHPKDLIKDCYHRHLTGYSDIRHHHLHTRNTRRKQCFSSRSPCEKPNIYIEDIYPSVLFTPIHIPMSDIPHSFKYKRI